MGEISAASEEQSLGIAQVNQTITQMDEVTQQNAALVEEATSAAHAMEDQARRLSEAVSAFTLNDGVLPGGQEGAAVGSMHVGEADCRENGQASPIYRLSERASIDYLDARRCFPAKQAGNRRFVVDRRLLLASDTPIDTTGYASSLLPATHVTSALARYQKVVSLSW